MQYASMRTKQCTRCAQAEARAYDSEQLVLETSKHLEQSRQVCDRLKGVVNDLLEGYDTML